MYIEQYLCPWPNIPIYIEYRQNVKSHPVQEFGHDSVFSITLSGLEWIESEVAIEKARSY